MDGWCVSPKKEQNEEFCSDSVIWLYPVNIPVMLLYFGLLGCYQEGPGHSQAGASGALGP